MARKPKAKTINSQLMEELIPFPEEWRREMCRRKEIDGECFFRLAVVGDCQKICMEVYDPSGTAEPQGVKIIDWPRCKTCRWWRLAYTAHLGPDQCRPCECPKLGEAFQLYERRLKTHLDILAYEYNESGCLLPGPNFGCIHHEEKA